jgi:surface antigen
MNKTGIALLTMMLATPAYAFNVGALSDAPVTRLTSAEVKAFRAFVLKTLDEGADGASADWKAPKTVFTSQVTPTKSFTDGKLKCREATIESNAEDKYERGKYVFCKGDKGDWQFRTPSSRKQAQTK